MTPRNGILIGGPQDGCSITTGREHLPLVVNVGRKWLGDGYAAWSTEPCERFPCVYWWDGKTDRYIFEGYKTKIENIEPSEPCKG